MARLVVLLEVRREVHVVLRVQLLVQRRQRLFLLLVAPTRDACQRAFLPDGHGGMKQHQRLPVLVRRAVGGKDDVDVGLGSSRRSGGQRRLGRHGRVCRRREGPLVLRVGVRVRDPHQVVRGPPQRVVHAVQHPRQLVHVRRRQLGRMQLPRLPAVEQKPQPRQYQAPRHHHDDGTGGRPAFAVSSPAFALHLVPHCAVARELKDRALLAGKPRPETRKGIRRQGALNKRVIPSW
jgi:hypothetical protein